MYKKNTPIIQYYLLNKTQWVRGGSFLEGEVSGAWRRPLASIHFWRGHWEELCLHSPLCLHCFHRDCTYF